uniref:Uncharacterized protein LOC104217115 n=1 Tax=Nicotiana sylvestris TaxID=4096 RepID=A0A1U7VC13_NICSY|nr:PREDICTED: uncharacterized protein LOC104217115 [Nicotiana sylvestris]
MKIKKLLVIGDSDSLLHQVQGEWSTKNVKILMYLQYVKELCKKFTKIEFKHVPRPQNEYADALATLSSMIRHPDMNYIGPIQRHADPHERVHISLEDIESWILLDDYGKRQYLLRAKVSPVPDS